jgi:hypothetical protein
MVLAEIRDLYTALHKKKRQRHPRSRFLEQNASISEQSIY